MGLCGYEALVHYASEDGAFAALVIRRRICGNRMTNTDAASFDAVLQKYCGYVGLRWERAKQVYTLHRILHQFSMRAKPVHAVETRSSPITCTGSGQVLKCSRISVTLSSVSMVIHMGASRRPDKLRRWTRAH